jgi:hypothetical protein
MRYSYTYEVQLYLSSTAHHRATLNKYDLGRNDKTTKRQNDASNSNIDTLVIKLNLNKERHYSEKLDPDPNLNGLDPKHC